MSDTTTAFPHYVEAHQHFLLLNVVLGDRAGIKPADPEALMNSVKSPCLLHFQTFRHCTDQCYSLKDVRRLHVYTEPTWSDGTETLCIKKVPGSLLVNLVIGLNVTSLGNVDLISAMLTKGGPELLSNLRFKL